MVPVNHADVRRLMEATGASAEEITRLFKPGETDFEPDREGWIRFPYGQRVLGLQRKEGRCIFLDARQRCRVYPARPGTCRTFPLHVKYNCQGELKDIDYIPEVKCRRTLGAAENPETLVAAAIQEDEEDDRYYREVKQWNQSNRSGGIKEFLAFMGLERNGQGG